MQNIIIAICLLVIPLVFLKKYFDSRKGDREKLGDGIGADEIIVIEHKGFPLTMTQMEKLEYWDNMSEKEKKHHVHKVRSKIKKGQLKAVVWYTGQTVYVTPKYAKENNLEIANVGKRRLHAVK
jgi:hypothetical protein